MLLQSRTSILAEVVVDACRISLDFRTSVGPRCGFRVHQRRHGADIDRNTSLVLKLLDWVLWSFLRLERVGRDEGSDRIDAIQGQTSGSFVE